MSSTQTTTSTTKPRVPQLVLYSAMIFLVPVAIFSLALILAYLFVPASNSQCSGEICNWADVLGFLDVVVAIPTAVVGLVFIVLSFNYLKGRTVRQSGSAFVVLAAGLIGFLPLMLLITFLLN